MSAEIRYEILSRFATDETWKLVRGRLLEGERFFDKRKLSSKYCRDQVKLALLLIQIASPSEPLTSEELKLVEPASM